MKKLYFRVCGVEPDIECVDLCKYKERLSDGTMIGSATCQECVACYGWDREENWVKCLNHALENPNIEPINDVLHAEQMVCSLGIDYEECSEHPLNELGCSTCEQYIMNHLRSDATE